MKDSTLDEIIELLKDKYEKKLYEEAYEEINNIGRRRAFLF